MMKRLVFYTVILALLVPTILLQPPARADLLRTSQLAATATFVEAFDGAPPSPQPFGEYLTSQRWDIAIHGRDNRTSLRPFPHAGHGPDCAAPPATHDKGASYEDTVFLCRDHVMTAMHGDGYAVTYLTPNHLVDFSAGEAVIRWEMSTARTSERDWIDVWISPYADNLQLPLQPGFPDLQGPPRRAVQVLLTTENSLCPSVWRDGQEIEDNQAPYRCALTRAWQSVLTPSAERRDVFEVRLSRTHLTVWMPAYGLVWYDHDLRQPLDWTAGVVQFGHHSYSPEKGTRYCPAEGCGPNTWHWDTVSLSPARPFSITHTDRRYVDGTAPELGLASPVPSGGMLRFSAWGTNLATSTDGGATWQPARRAVQGDDCCHIVNYWTPIAAGATRVRFRADPWPGGAWQVKDVAVWSSTQEVPPSTPTPAAATPTSTLPPTASATATPAVTSTPSPTVEPSATPSATPTAAATAPPAPTVTPTPTRRCVVWSRWSDDGGRTWLEDWSAIDCGLIGGGP